MLRFFVRRLGFILFVSVLIVYAAYLGMGLARNSDLHEPSFSLIEPSQSAWAQTRAFFSAAAQGDLGTVGSPSGLLPVRAVLQESYVNSLGLLLAALAVAAILGVGFGSRSALRGGRRSPLALLTLTVIGISVPSFFLGLLLQQGAIRYQQEFGGRLVSMAGLGWDVEHMLLPVIVLSARPLAFLTRASYIAVDNVMKQDYIRTAFAKGLRRSWIILTHVGRNTSIPILTAVGISLRFSLGTLPVVEYFFAWPGLGLRVLQAIQAREADMVAASALALGLTFLAVNLLLDLSYLWIDPRQREESTV